MGDIMPAELFLWIGAVCGAVWVLVPPLAELLGLSWIHYVPHEDPRAVEPSGNDPDYQRRYRELQALGFRPIGFVSERVWFKYNRWFKAHHVRSMISADGLCYANLYRLDDAEPVRISFKTFTSGGGIVNTVTPGAGIQNLTETSLRVESPTNDLGELLAQHQENIKLFCEQRGFTVTPIGLQEMVARDEQHDRQLMASIDTSGLYNIPVCFFAGPIGLGYFWMKDKFPTAPWERLVPAAVCFGTLCYLAYTKLVLPQLFRAECLRSHPANAASE
jgi:hypothetical protein